MAPRRRHDVRVRAEHASVGVIWVRAPFGPGGAYGVDGDCGAVWINVTRRRSVWSSAGTNTCRRWPERGASHVLDTWKWRSPTVALRNVRVPESSTWATT